MRAEAKTKVREKGWRVMGRQRVLMESPYKRARSFLEYGARTPTLAVGRGNGELLKREIKELQHFRQRYREALEKYKAGITDIAFPEGTWWMRVFRGARVEPILI